MKSILEDIKTQNFKQAYLLYGEEAYLKHQYKNKQYHMERNMNREVETIREKVHTTADAALFLCFQEVKGSHSKGVIRLPLLHYDIPFEGYGEMLLRMNRIYDLLGMPDAGSCMRSLSEGEKEEWEFTDEMKNNQDTTLPAGTERMVSIQIQFRQHCSLQGFLI